MKQLLAIVLGLALVGGTIPDAEACINGVIRKRIPSIKHLQNAEDLIAQGQYKQAARLLRKRGKLVRVSRKSAMLSRRRVARLVQRREQLLTALTIHTGGRYRLNAACCSRSKKERRRNLKRALARLKKRKAKTKAAARKGGDPTKDALRAVAMAQLPGDRTQARKILEDLAARDLVPSAQAWLTLARLRTDEKAIATALLNCKRTSRDPRMCTR